MKKEEKRLSMEWVTSGLFGKCFWMNPLFTFTLVIDVK